MLTDKPKSLPVLATTRSVAVEAIAERARTRPIRIGVPYVTSYGGGLDSVYVAERFVREPALRPFALADWTLVMAQTGDEFRDIADYHERAGVLADLAAAATFSNRSESVSGPRFVQVARSGRAGSAAHVLDDSRSPTRLFVEGAFALSDEMLSAGSVPATTGNRKCSLKSKGTPIDWVIGDYLGLAEFTHSFGFDSDETSRIARSEAAIAERNFVRQGLRRAGMEFTADDPWWLDTPEARCGEVGDYPMLRWGVSRGAAAEWLALTLGSVSPRSCCRYCPFQKPWADATVLARWRNADPRLLARDLLMEHQALGLNPRMELFFRRGSLRSWVERAGAHAALEEFARLLAASTFALWRVRRMFVASGSGRRQARRRTQKIAVGPLPAMQQLFEESFAAESQIVEEHGFRYAFRRSQEAGAATATEEYFVVAPAIADEKMNSRLFEQQWYDLHPDASLPAGESVQSLLGF